MVWLADHLTRAADDSIERLEAQRQFYEALERIPDGDTRYDLEEAFGEAWLAAAYAMVPRTHLGSAA